MSLATLEKDGSSELQKGKNYSLRYFVYVWNNMSVAH